MTMSTQLNTIGAKAQGRKWAKLSTQPSCNYPGWPSFDELGSIANFDGWT